MVSLTRRVLVLQQDQYSSPGLVGDRLRERGYELFEHRADRDGPIPNPREFDMVLMMGSAYSVYDPAIQGWFRREIEALESAAASDVPVLGVCFGAQALAQVLGGSVRRAERAELGWVRIDTDDPRRVDAGPWFEWHHDVLEPPPGAEIIARSPAGVQVYAAGPHLGVQFHPEITESILRSWVAVDPSELIENGIDPQGLVDQTVELGEERRSAVYDLVDRFVAGLPDPPQRG